MMSGTDDQSSQLKWMFEISDPLGYTVRLSEDVWYGHITENHTDMTKEFDTIKLTIEDPCLVYSSSDYDNRNVYFRDRKAYNSSLKYCKVIVEYDGSSKNGEVVSAFKRKKIGGNIKDEAPKYTRPELR